MMQDTRQQILTILKERGQATVEQLGAELNLTSATIRHHLDILRGEGLVEAPEIRRRSTPGRPQHVYGLTEAACSQFPQNYAGLATMLLSEIGERLSSSECNAILQNIATDMTGEFPRGAADKDFESRLRRVVDFLNSKGYMASCAKNEGEYQLSMVNCPYREVVQSHSQVCKIDEGLIAQLLDIAPRHVSRMAVGDTACVFCFGMPSYHEGAG